MSGNLPSFYLTGLSPDGYFSLAEKPFTDNDDGKTYIIKGGRYSASPMLIEMLADEIEKEGFYTERMMNFLEKSKLDGVYFPEINVTVIDGNSPVCAEPLFCDCKQFTVGLSDCVDKISLFNFRNEIIENILKEKEITEKAVRFLSAAKSIHNDSLRVLDGYVDDEKIERFVARFTKREFGVESGGGAKEIFRFLGSVSPDGVSIFDMTIKSICPKIYVVEDKVGAVSETLISLLRDSALICGFDVISCICPMKSKENPEHIIVPELGLGIFTSNKLHPYKGDIYRKINSSRFTDSETLSKNKIRINFNLKAEKDLIEQASYLLYQAEEKRKITVGIYEKYTDRNKVCEIKDSLKNEILSAVKLN